MSGLVEPIAALFGMPPGDLRGEGVTDETELQGWLGARGLHLVPADPALDEVSPGFWIAEHDDGTCVLMFDEGPFDGGAPAATPPRRALVLAALDPTRLAVVSAGAPRAGVVEALLTASAAEAPMAAHDAVQLHAGRGIPGDRYYDGTGTFSAGSKLGRELTLVEAEAIEALGLGLGVADARRNVVTRGVDLNALVGREFRLGTARCIGRRLCEPCSHLQRLTGVALLRPLVHRGGLRADVLESGVVRLGDTLDVAPRGAAGSRPRR